ncbi:DNA mismatch repair protein MutS [Candidatus Clostridium radicumherbarum]|uniref:DNA mismatch repair protein MutS n=1 Tax=Candidatus Clostridium radicumherbarum TaxID=3381662 RepID=A0ABW8TS18_9CLOT
MSLTPMMQQYMLVKEKCKDCILFFRLGDFYEMFFEDAEIASRELELVLTGRDCGLENRAPMCGIPFHAADSYIGRLVNRGFKVAICEQLEDPSLAKGIVKRDIIKIVTPGTYTDSTFLEENTNNYLMSIFVHEDKIGICFADISTGDFYSTEFNKNYDLVLDELSKYSPKEILADEKMDKQLKNKIEERFSIIFSEKNEEYFKAGYHEKLKQFSNSNDKNVSLVSKFAANGLLSYIQETQKLNLTNINKIEYYDVCDYLNIDINTRRNLELTETLRDKTKKGSLLWVIDKTHTSMGSRTLRKWVEQPLLNRITIENRLDSVKELTENLSILEDLKIELKNIYDMERIVGKVSNKSVNAKELVALKNSLGNIPAIKEIISNVKSSKLLEIYENLDELRDVYELLNLALIENPGLSIKEGNIIKEGYNSIIDELREAKFKGKEWIAQLENSEREQTGIKSLKVGFNKVFGYYIEITNANKGLIPEGRYIRKQTLSNAERYITPELKEMEDKILGAEDKLINLEYQLFIEIRDKVENEIDRMKKVASNISQLDCLSALAITAMENNYTRPRITEDGVINIEEGRHPVIEKIISAGGFVSNDTSIDTKESMLLLITGPNMAGKSTYMRQVALITLLAHIGSFVPAKSASISVCDRIFTRIGASDDLSAGKSTFMVEMWEVSNILKSATNKSLVLLDEVGRGTSTYDGLSIAWAVIEYICKSSKIKCKTLFATHYHELTKLEASIKGVKNYSVAVKEINNEIVFLRKIVEGGADQSYGIEVAKLAGLPEELIIRAKELLLELENKDNIKITEDLDIKEEPLSLENKRKHRERSQKEAAVDSLDNIMQLNFQDISKNNLIKEIQDLNILELTPMEGFNKLYEIINKAKSL